MAVTLVTTKPAVVKLGNGYVEDRISYVDGGTFEKGDLIRITSGGEIKVAAVDSDTVGAVHGIVMEARTAEVNTTVPITRFAEDTVVRMQMIDDESPADINKGGKYELETSGGAWGVTATTTKAIATIVGYAGDNVPWTDKTGTYSYSSATDNGYVDVVFGTDINNLSVLEGRAA